MDARGSEFSEGENGGRGEIRTHETLTGLPVFKTGALNHSATLPRSAFPIHRVCRQILNEGMRPKPRMCGVSRKNATIPRSRLILLEIGSVLSQQTAVRRAIITATRLQGWRW